MIRVPNSARCIVFGIVALLLFPLTASSTSLGAISGRVRDSQGSPVAGALVTAIGSAPNGREEMAFTDKWGEFHISRLFAGKYSLRVSMPWFLPVVQHNIQIDPGGAVLLTVNLQTALDVLRRGKDENQAEDIIWTLRSSRSTQPVLRLTEDGAAEEDIFDSLQTLETSGYFQLYSKSVETSSGAIEGVGSHFSLTMPLAPRTQVTVAGQYSEVPTQPRGFGALYEFAPSARHRSQVGLKVRQGALFADPLYGGSLKEVQLQYGEQFLWSDHVVLNYGAEVGRAEAVSDRSYLRPRFGVSWVPQRRTTISLGGTSQAPAFPDDPVRGHEYFDRILYVPPDLEEYLHVEASVSRILTERLEVSAGLFRDRADAQALFVSAEGRQGILILDTRNHLSEGFRVVLNRQFRNFEAGIGYTAARGAELKSVSFVDVNELQSQIAPRQFQVVTGRFKADLHTTQTEITAIYRWMSGFSVLPIDPYQQMFEYNDPSLSVTVAQNLPGWRTFPGTIQAIVDARNVFEHSFGHHTQVSQHPRLLKGGINIKF